MKKVIITGASGFVGANLLRRLIDDGCEVHCFFRDMYNPARVSDVKDKFITHIVDLRNWHQVVDMVTKINPDWIFHLAVYGAYSTQNDWKQMISTNIVCTANLLEACLKTGFECFVNTGSSSEYGCKDFAPKEDTLPEPNSYYSVTKNSATMYCQYVAEANKCYIPTLRLYSVYGSFEEESRFIPTIIREGFSGKYPPLVSPDTARDFIYIDDVVDAYINVAANSEKNVSFGAVYNLGTGVQTTIGDVVKISKETFAIKHEPKWGSMENKSWDTKCWIADSSLYQKTFGVDEFISFKDGFNKFVDWYKDNV